MSERDPAEAARHLHDVVIVGAGLAGLAAAHALRDLDVLVVEREARVGGRVWTKTSAQGLDYELGALLVTATAGLPPSLSTGGVVAQRGPVGLMLESRLSLDAHVAQAAWSHPAFTPEERGALLAALRAPEDLCDAPRITAVLEAFHGAIHAGPRAAYIAHRRSDFGVRPNTDFLASGNGSLARAFLDELPTPPTLEAEVLRVQDMGPHVVVETGPPRGLSRRARTVVVATTPAAARGLFAGTPIDDRCRRFLEALRFAPGTAVAIGLRECRWPPFAYVATPGSAFSTVYQRRFEGGTVVVAYTMGEARPAWLDAPRDAQLDHLLRAFAAAGLPVERRATLFWDAHHWTELAPVISEQAYGDWTAGCVRPGPRVRLAGDYTSWDDDEMPYGMRAAIESGWRAAREVRQVVERGAS